MLYYVKYLLEDVHGSLLYKLNPFTDIKGYILVIALVGRKFRLEELKKKKNVAELLFGHHK